VDAHSTVAKAAIALTCAVAMTVVAGTGAAGANSMRLPTKAETALRKTAQSWVYYADRGNAQKACLRQTEPAVNGIPCEQLPDYGVVLYCPAFEGPPDGSAPSPYRRAAETVVKVRVKANGDAGTAVFRSTGKSSSVSAKAGFEKIDGSWRIAWLQGAGRRLAPAGLIFTDGAELREQLWPVHC
jgi:hypothetical protein